jgi:hypothetical protein
VTVDQMTEDGFTQLALVSAPSAPPGTIWNLRAELGPYTGLAPPIRLDPPDVITTIDQCEPASPCSLTGGATTAVVRVSAAGQSTQHITLRSRLDGVLQSTVLPGIDAAQVVGDRVVGVAFVPVPAARAGASWEVIAELGSQSDATDPVTIVAPPVTVALACGDCQPSAGTTVTAFVTAPLGLRDQTATITVVTGGGVAILLGSAVSLDTVDNTHQTISGSISIPVPSTPGQSLIIDATAGGYRATTLVVAIGPAP